MYYRNRYDTRFCLIRWSISRAHRRNHIRSPAHKALLLDFGAPQSGAYASYDTWKQYQWSIYQEAIFHAVRLYKPNWIHVYTLRVVHFFW